MKKILLFLLILVGTGFAQTQDLLVGMEISGFQVPDYNEEGQLRAKLYGEHAKVLKNGEVEITHLKIELYKDGTLEMTVFSPHCFFNREQRSARSEGSVLIDSTLLTIVGRGFFWSAEGGQFEILHDSKVMIKEAAQTEIKGFEL